MWLFLILLAQPQNTQGLEKSSCSCDPKILQAQELSPDLFALYSLYEPRKVIHTCVEPIIDPPLPVEQAGFWHGRSTVNHAVLLIQNIEDGFEEKIDAVFIDMTATYDTMWKSGLTSKLLKFLPDKHMIRTIV